VPFLIHVAFSFNAPFSFLVARWEAGNVLEFYGAIVGAAGTAVLGYVAFWQTKRAHAQADRANEISEKLIALEQNKITPRLNMRWSGAGGGMVSFRLRTMLTMLLLTLK